MGLVHKAPTPHSSNIRSSCISSPIYGILKVIYLILCKDERKYMDGTDKASPDGGSGYGNFMEVPL